jgi:hypothetical protein
MAGITGLCEAFFAASSWAHYTEFNGQDFEETVTGLMTHPNFVLVAEEGGEIVGVIAIVIHPLFFNAATKIALECFWYVKPDFRGNIGKKLHEYAAIISKINGADYLNMATVGLKVEALDRLYKRKGYAPHERTYIKRLA